MFKLGLKSRFYHPMIIILVYLVIHAALRLLLSDTLQVDDREQILIAQNLELGYKMPQPPLYSWLSWFFFKIFGPNLFALTLLKYTLIYITFYFIWKIGDLILNDENLKKILLFSYLLMPSFFWHMHQGFTHTILLGFGIVSSLYYLFKLERKICIKNFLLFGLSISIGLMGKYSFILFLLPILLSSLYSSEYRPIYHNKKSFVILIPIIIIVGPHLIWLSQNLNEIFFMADQRLAINSSEVPNIDTGIKIFASFFGFITPLIFFFIPLLFLARRKLNSSICQTRLLNNFYFLVGLLIILFVIMFEIQNIKVRWLHPLMMIFPIWAMLLLNSEKNLISLKASKIFFALVISLSIIVVSIRVVQMTIGPNLGYYGRLNMPITETIKKIPEEYLQNQILILDYDIFAHFVTIYPWKKTIYEKQVFNSSAPAEEKCLIIDNKKPDKNKDQSLLGEVETLVAKYKYQIYYSVESIKKCS